LGISKAQEAIALIEIFSAATWSAADLVSAMMPPLVAA
jgi:hypothetical protein